MAKKRGQKPKAEKGAAESATGGGSIVENGKATSKADAVRAALKEGVEKPQDAAAWIKEKFGLDISPAMFSNYKSVLGRKEGFAAGPGRGRGSGRPAGSGKASGSIDLAVVEEVKNLVQRVGADQIKQLVEFFK